MREKERERLRERERERDRERERQRQRERSDRQTVTERLYGVLILVIFSPGPGIQWTASTSN